MRSSTPHPRGDFLRQLVKDVVCLLVLAVVRPVRDAWRSLTRTHPVRVFTFHRVTDVCRDGMTVSPAVFRDQIGYIARYHDIVPVERAIALLGSGTRLSRPAAALTFDDGYLSVFDEARPAMAALGLPGCCYVSTGLVGTDRRFAHDDQHPLRAHFGVMTWEQVSTLHAEGWSIGGHTINHPRLSTLDTATLERELREPLDVLRQKLGLTQISMAYPFGQPRDITPEGFALAERLGYTAVFSDSGGENFPGSAGFHLRRIEIGGSHPTLAWMTRVHGLDIGDWRSWRTRAGA